ncbi:AbrB/MazE/SpoVT family DNA-binding domain-containing protein [Bacillus sp. UMB0728]|uniref:AbrB/MazE/SpoVT family DNA-binding domain-containing protein n=1 Tax=Bacillus sp. UMB0728 TaxID=2066052 RepID=UPI000C789784|nr:AbrB/MazE/SpoVT family DNA-binding domain-containing protein [Bacillus sp. UMB0728]PLR70578.1 AbrB family transcriptional regulator [Bacillus sp. UMB0728]
MVKSTGIVRRVDELGRIVIPIEIRRVLEINIKDPIEVFVEEEKIILQKYQPHLSCTVTGDVSPRNRTFANGNIVLSPEGMEQLIQELELAINIEQRITSQ